jgi:hypothetical protein
MPSPDSYKFYEAYVENVRGFLFAEKEIRRSINRYLKQNRTSSIFVFTKVYALLYSTYAEAALAKLIFTPYGYTQVSVSRILSKSSVQEKWLECLELAFLKFGKSKKGSEIPNKKQAIKKIIKEYIIEPSELRNKIAHGQYSHALNSKNTALHPDLTTRIASLNVVQIQRWFEINNQLCSIIEDLIESPERAHYNQYYTKYQRLEEYIKKSKLWTIESKLQTKSMKKIIKHE